MGAMDRIRSIWAWLRKWVARPFSAISILLALLWFPPDIRDLPEAYGWKWGDLMLDRETVLLAIATIALLWIMWMDVRPAVMRKMQRPLTEFFSVSPEVYCESYPMNWDDGESSGIYATDFFVRVGNKQERGKTLRNVQARTFLIGAPTLCRVKETKADMIDIRHGEWVLFELGRIVSKKAYGIVFRPDSTLNKDAGYQNNFSQGFLDFEVHNALGQRQYGISYRPGQTNPWNLFLIISADDTVAKELVVNINMGDEKTPVTIDQTIT